MELSIVTTLYYSQQYIEEFYSRIKKQAEMITENFEIIFVNDGSPDNSLNIVLSLQEKDDRIIIIDLSRNFGHHKAIMAGLSHSSGEKIFLIDIDLEEEPELLGVFNNILNEGNRDVVYGVQTKRKGGLIERITGDIFYRIINLISNTNIPKNFVTARIMNKKFVKSLLLYQEREIFLGGLWSLTGFNQFPYKICKHSSGKTTYKFFKRVNLMVNAITSLINRPLIYIFNIGALISFLSVVYSIYLAIRKIFFAIPIEGWTSLIVSLWFLGGVIILFNGIIGFYLSKIFIEVKQRPNVIIKDIFRSGHYEK